MQIFFVFNNKYDLNKQNNYNLTELIFFKE